MTLKLDYMKKLFSKKFIVIPIALLALSSCKKTTATPANPSPIFTSSSGTGSLLADNSTVSNYTLVPGLNAVIKVPTNSTNQVLIETDGGIQLNSSDVTASGFTDMAIFINGVQLSSERRIPVLNTTNLIYSVSSYSFTEEATLAAGSYTIDVRAKKYSTIFSDCLVSSDSTGSILVGNPKLQGILNITQFP